MATRWRRIAQLLDRSARGWGVGVDLDAGPGDRQVARACDILDPAGADVANGQIGSGNTVTGSTS